LQDPSLAYRFQESVFENQDQFLHLGEPFLYQTADKLGVDVAKMKTDMGSPQVERQIEEDRKLARANGIEGTPSFLIGSEKVVGALPYDQIRKVIDEQLHQE
jgi:predicted DsbA family dithiol-disulfide isomerase